MLAVFSVDNLNDSGAGSLREAITSANLSINTPDEITFSVNGTINTASQLPSISDALTITGPGANLLTINAGGASRVMSITSGTVNVSGLTLTGGMSYRGGGVHNYGGTNTTLADVVIQGNTAYAGNYAGGGVFNQGNLTITRSTIASNTAPNGGSQGGGVFNLGGTVNIVNSTISGNTAVQFGGGVRNLGGTISIEHSTLTSNSTINPGGLGGGIFIGSGLVTLGHTIVAGNSAGVGEEIFRGGGSGIIVGNYNLFGEATISTGQALIGFGPGPTDLTATFDGSVPTPLAGILNTTLATNGGATLTHALEAGSPAIDTGDFSFGGTPDTDQRRVPFVRVNGAIDIGAFEVQSLAMVVDTLADESDGNYSAGDLSLREALQLANGLAGADTVSFAAGLAGGTINLNAGLGQIVISDSVTVMGLGANQLTINAGGASRVLQITSGTVNVNGLTLTGGNADRGGGLRSELAATTTLTAMAIEGNTATSATDAGGGIWSSGNLTITGSTISNNTAPNGRGGGIHATGFTTIESSTISDNSAGSHGGGLYHAGISPGIPLLSAVILRSTISGNTVGGSGGGVYKVAGGATIIGSVISGNTAVGSGQEIYRHMINTGLTLNAFNLIGDSSKTTTQALRLVVAGVTDILATSNGTNPAALAAILAPLANNGGPTKTHALVVGSPAINAGDPGFTTPPDFDQRGAGYQRVVNGRVDIGALEVQAPSADFDFDGDIDGRDFLAWQRGYGTPAPTAVKSQGDADNDLDVDGSDLTVWQDQYGTVPPLVAVSAISSAVSVEEEFADDADPGSAMPGFALVILERDEMGDSSIAFGELNVEEVDRALEELSTVTRYGVREFGEMVVRRGVKRTGIAVAPLR